MTRIKRNHITPARRQELRADGAVYVISCNQPGCVCGHPGSGCQRGFFSLFLQAIYGMAFASRLDMPWYIDYGNGPYLYAQADQFNGDSNFWNYYFQQPILDSSRQPVYNQFHENYPLRIWHQAHVQKLHKVLKEQLIFQPKVQALFQDQKDKFKNRKVLGLQIRRTDHSQEASLIPWSRYLAMLQMYESQYDQFFVATDYNAVIQQLIDVFGPDKIVYHPATRSDDEQAVHTNAQRTNRHQLGLEVLLDCYCLSLCNKALLISSNISFAALLFNPYLPYQLLENWPDRKKRYKTELLYHLDRWGLRKM